MSTETVRHVSALAAPTAWRRVHFLLLGALLRACAGVQPGTERLAAAAANDFIELLAVRRAHDAWKLLTPSTRAEAYDSSPEEFARDVRRADWSSVRWTIGPVSDHEISWGVYIELTDGEVPRFLVEREIAAMWSGGLHLLVQVHEDGTYQIAGRAIDERRTDGD